MSMDPGSQHRHGDQRSIYHTKSIQWDHSLENPVDWSASEPSELFKIFLSPPVSHLNSKPATTKAHLQAAAGPRQHTGRNCTKIGGSLKSGRTGPVNLLIRDHLYSCVLPLCINPLNQTRSTRSNTNLLNRSIQQTDQRLTPKVLAACLPSSVYPYTLRTPPVRGSPGNLLGFPRCDGGRSNDSASI